MSGELSDLGDLSMIELFRVEVETQCAILTAGLLALDRDPNAVDRLDTLMRAAHSLKGAARIMNLSVSVRLAHAMEDCFVSAQRGERRLGAADVDLLLQGVDFLTRVSKGEEGQLENWEKEHEPQIEPLITNLSRQELSAAAADSGTEMTKGTQGTAGVTAGIEAATSVIPLPEAASGIKETPKAATP